MSVRKDNNERVQVVDRDHLIFQSLRDSILKNTEKRKDPVLDLTHTSGFLSPLINVNVWNNEG